MKSKVNQPSAPTVILSEAKDLGIEECLRIGDPSLALRMTCLLVIALTLLAGAARASEEIPAPAQTKPIAIVGATVHPISGPDIEQATLIFENGKISAVGKDLSIPASAEKIDASGKHVYPGLIDASNDIGLTEVSAVRAMRDMTEAGSINPNARPEVAINPDSEIIPITRANGVLLAGVTPEGGVLSGSVAMMQLDGWTWEDMTLRAPLGIALNWPNMSPIQAWWMHDSPKKQLEKRDEQLKNIRQVFDDARAYRAAKEKNDSPTSRPSFDARWEAMMPLLDGKIPLIVRANEVQQIESAVAFAQREKVKLIIDGAYDAPLCAELLKSHKVPVIIGSVQRLPMRRGDAYDDPATLAARLARAGVKFCISGKGNATMARNLPYQAAASVAAGLPHDDGLKSITLWPAEILGVADRVGSLDVGKDATIIVTDGDPLQTPTHVEQAFIQGRKIDLNDRQQRLWRKYQEKYKQTAPPPKQPTLP
jgi:imidazolonepropionase-like amidohydrolase